MRLLSVVMLAAPSDLAQKSDFGALAIIMLILSALIIAVVMLEAKAIRDLIKKDKP